MDIFEELRAPFPEGDIEWRVGATNQDKSKGMALPYITARAIMVRLDSVLGPTEWQDSYQIYNEGKQLGVVCNLSIRVGGEWISKEDGAPFTDFEAFKGGISDALKRAAVKYGIGRYLYDAPIQWVPLRNGRLANRPSLNMGTPITTPVLEVEELPQETEVSYPTVDDLAKAGIEAKPIANPNQASEKQWKYIMFLKKKTELDADEWGAFQKKYNFKGSEISKKSASQLIDDLQSR